MLSQHQKSFFDRAPIDVLMRLFSHLRAENLSSIRRVNKKFNMIAKSNSLWEGKLAQHFPLRQSLKIKTGKINTDWYAEFVNANNEEYKDLSVNSRKLFSLIKEGGDDSLIELKKILRLRHLHIEDINGISVLSWIAKKGHQTILNHVYDLVVKNYSYNNSRTITLDITDQVKRTLLHWAAICNQPLNTIKELLVQGYDVNVATLSGYTPLSLASTYGYLNIVEYLIANSAHVNTANSADNTPLHLATHNGYYAIIKCLLENRADVNAIGGDGAIPIMIAAQHDRADIVKLLLEHGADIDAVTSQANNVTPLLLASQFGHLEVVNFLLVKGANVNAAHSVNNAAPLFVAAQNGHLNVVKMLLAHGAKINTTLTNGMTPLYIATLKRQQEVIKVLLENNADIHLANDEGKAPLFLASFQGNLPLVNTLLAKGANPNVACTDGGTPLFVAMQEMRLDIVHALLAKGANINLARIDGVTPLYVTAHRNPIEFIKNISINYINENHTKECIINILALLDNDKPDWWADIMYDKLAYFAHKLINKLYPDLLNAIDMLTNDDHFTLVKTAIQYQSLHFGLAEYLDILTDMYVTGLLGDKIGSMLGHLRNKLEEASVYNTSEPALTKKELTNLQQFVAPLHYILMNTSNSYNQAALSWTEKRKHTSLCRLSDVENFPVKNTLNRLLFCTNWSSISNASVKNSHGDTKVLMDLADYNDIRLTR